VVVKRGEIRWASIPGPRGSEPGHRRPVLIVQSDAFNRSRIGTVLAVVISSNLRLGEAPGNVELTARQSGLPRRSVVNVSQVITLDRRYLDDRVGRLAPRHLAAVDEGLRLVLSL
jgi:mRNA interferase MazF